MKKAVILVLFLTLSGFGLKTHAQELPGNMELGIIMGDPTGLSGKYWTGSDTAFDFGLAWSLRGEGSMHIHSDYLLHKDWNPDELQLRLYYGVGARLLLTESPKMALRIPGGVQYLIQDTRFGLFFELAPLLNIIPDTSFEVNGGLGVRYFI
jgi:hypothetical protein